VTESRFSLPLLTAKVYADSVPDDLGGQPFPDGEEPEFHHGAADEEFAALVLDEDFVRSAVIHEPTAVERILAAAQSHAESETVRGFEDGHVYGPGGEGEFGLDDDPDGAGDPEGLSGPEDPDDPDDEGRFDSSDYTEYLEPSDGDEYDHYESYGQYESYGPYNYNSFGDTGHYGPHQYGRFAHYDQYDQYGQYIRFGINRRYDPRFDLGEEHGSDYRRRPAHGKHGAAPRTRRHRPYRGHARWQRPVAWLLALMMGIGMVALALGAVYRSTSQQRQDPSPPPATTSGVDSSDKAGREGEAGEVGVADEAGEPGEAARGIPGASAQSHPG
jgi:hypothetical protein